MIYFTADLHFGHFNIIGYSYRPYKSVREMEIGLLKNINSVVNKTDDLYILGDLTLSKDPAYIKVLLDKINGNKHLILGNHDYLKPLQYLECGFQRVHTSIEIDGMELVHDPAWAVVDKTKLFLCGHVHDLFVTCNKNVLNVGVDVWNYKPLSMDELKYVINIAIDKKDIVLQK